MYLFSRRRHVNPGKARAAVAMAIQSGAQASEITGHPISVWSAVMSPDVGAIVWSVTVDHLDEIEVASDKLATSGEFGDLVEQSESLWSGPLTDSLVEVIHGSPGEQRPEYVQVTRAVCGRGTMAAAMAAGAEVVDAARRITGLEGVFAADVTGAFGGVAWFFGAPDLGVLDAANAALAADAGWLETVDRCTPLYEPGAPVTLYRRLA